MPNINRQQTVYIPTGNPDTVNENSSFGGISVTPPAPPMYEPGTLGMAYDYNDRAYQIVLAPAANQLMFWKNRANYIVTNDPKQCDFGPTNFRNAVAGVLRTAATPGNVVHVLIRGRRILVKGTAGAVGDTIIANSGTACDTTNVAAGTAVTWQEVGTCAVVSGDSTNGTVDVDIPNIP